MSWENVCHLVDSGTFSEMLRNETVEGDRQLTIHSCMYTFSHSIQIIEYLLETRLCAR